MSLLLAVLYLALPAYVANMAPVVAGRLGVWQQLARPIDGGARLRGKRVLGDNKTWRGVVVAMLGAAVVVVMQYALQLSLPIATQAYSSLLVALMYGVYVGALVMLGDAVGSCIKRQCGVQSGAPFLVLDQLDFMLAFIIGTIAVTVWTLEAAALLALCTFLANLTTNALAYRLGVKNTYW